MEGRDVEQAYPQAEMKGPPVYITLPQDLWTEDMYKMKNPVVRLEKASCGHKHSGVYWQEFCKEQVLKARLTSQKIGLVSLQVREQHVVDRVRGRHEISWTSATHGENMA